MKKVFKFFTEKIANLQHHRRTLSKHEKKFYFFIKLFFYNFKVTKWYLRTTSYRHYKQLTRKILKYDYENVCFNNSQLKTR